MNVHKNARLTPRFLRVAAPPACTSAGLSQRSAVPNSIESACRRSHRGAEPILPRKQDVRRSERTYVGSGLGDAGRSPTVATKSI